MKTTSTSPILVLMSFVSCLAVLLIFPLLSSGQLITGPQISPATQTAKIIADEMNQEFDRRIHLHTRLFALFWRNPDATPDQIAAALGNQALRLFQLSRENIENIDCLATLLGKDVSDYIPAADRLPPPTVTPNPDGTATLGTEP